MYQTSSHGGFKEEILHLGAEDENHRLLGLYKRNFSQVMQGLSALDDYSTISLWCEEKLSVIRTIPTHLMI
jgi:hypothetical protein